MGRVAPKAERENRFTGRGLRFVMYAQAQRKSRESRRSTQSI